MTHHAPSTGSVGVVLPADWHVVDLTNDTTRQADVIELVDRDDELAARLREAFS